MFMPKTYMVSYSKHFILISSKGERDSRHGLCIYPAVYGRRGVGYVVSNEPGAMGAHLVPVTLLQAVYEEKLLVLKVSELL